MHEAYCIASKLQKNVLDRMCAEERVFDARQTLNSVGIPSPQMVETKHLSQRLKRCTVINISEHNEYCK